MSEERWENGEEQVFARRLPCSATSSPVGMSFPGSKGASTGSLIPGFRFTSRPDSAQGPTRAKANTDSGFFGARARRASTQSSHKGRETKHDDRADIHASPTSTSFTHNGSLSSSHFKPSYEVSRPATIDAAPAKKNRGGILSAASDALSFRFGRKRPIIRQPPMPTILPDVIEISARRRDEEDQERERLRDRAAQAIGLQVITPDTHSLALDPDIEEGVNGEVEAVAVAEAEAEQEVNLTTSQAEAESNFSNIAVPQSPQDSIHPIPPASPLVANRFRPRSLLLHSRTNSLSLTPIPLFPATFNTINQFQQSGTMLYKYHPPSSLRIFALSKNWRHRFMVLSTPTALATRNPGPLVSYLHLFKSSAGEEKEIERLEINEDSVVFIAEEEVGGRKHVVKVGGVDVGVMKKELNFEDAGRTMWFLHITDPIEAQKWITVIKTAILGQRTIRAGLGLPGSTVGGIEPRGDMDVMLSMRAQGLITPPTSVASNRPVQNGSQTSSQPDGNYASSISSRRSQATVSKSTSNGAVSTFKGLFTGSTRPRSTSRATSIDSQQDWDRDLKEDSFTSKGNHLLSNLRGSASELLQTNNITTTHIALPFTGPVSSPEHLERKIAIDRPIQWTSTSASVVETPPVKSDRTTRALSMGALSLQPPPRKRWTSSGPARPGPELSIHTNGHSDILPDTVPAEVEPPPSPNPISVTFGTPEQRPRAASIQSVSTMGSAENNAGAERSSSSTKRNSMKRWSRQGVLPRRLSPPSGPPPSIPTNQSATASRGGRLSVELLPRPSSAHSASSQKSFVSSLPSFSKRASGSSVHSTSSTPSPSVSRPTSSHRVSMPPPPRPPPTSALPPAPDRDVPEVELLPTSASRPSFRDSVSHRAFRLSMIAPKPPPSSVLPPRPDEVQPKSHRRSSSAGSFAFDPTLLDAIPASPVPPVIPATPPFPPPIGPLPPTPTSSQPTSSTPAASRPLSRHISIKQRLRILSAPSAAAAATASVQSTSGQTAPEPLITDILDGVAPLRRPQTANSNSVWVSSPMAVSPPATPIAEKITHYQNDLSFLQLRTPVTPHLPPPRALPIPPEPEVVSLLPPPRRGSKQINIVEVDAESPVGEDEKLTTEGEHRLISLSRPGSVISLGLMSL